jgi:hypothetical protein
MTGHSCRLIAGAAALRGRPRAAQQLNRFVCRFILPASIVPKLDFTTIRFGKVAK